MNHRWDGKESCGTTIDVYSTRPVETSGSNFRQLSGANATAFFKISKNRAALRGMPKISKKFSRKFSLHSTLLPENLEFSVEWFAFLKLNNFQNFWKLFREISVPFAAVSTFSKSFGFMESALCRLVGITTTSNDQKEGSLFCHREFMIFFLSECVKKVNAWKN